MNLRLGGGLELIGEVTGTVEDLRAKGGGMQAVFRGQGRLWGLEVEHTGTLLYRGTPEFHTGRLDIAFVASTGPAIRLRGAHFGHHLDTSSALLHAVGRFEAVASAFSPLPHLTGAVAVVEISVESMSTYRAVIYRKVERCPSSRVVICGRALAVRARRRRRTPSTSATARDRSALAVLVGDLDR